MASIKQQTNGKWRYRIRYKENGKFKEISKTGFRTKKDAQLAANDLEKKYHNGTIIGNSSINVSDFIEDWLEVYKKPSVRKSTYARIERATRLHIIPHFGMMKLNEIKRIDVVRWVNILSENQKRGTVLSNLSVLKDILNNAVYEQNILDKNVASRIRIGKDNDEVELKFYTKDELNLFLDYLESYVPGKYSHSIQYYVLFSLLARTGLRLGEALALNWTDFKGDTLSVDKTIAYDDFNNISITPPKTKSSIREIRLDSTTINLLKKQRINKKECLLMYTSYKKPLYQDMIFSNDNGNPLRHSVVRDFFYKMCKLSGVPVLSPHALRHSHAVHLLEAGANVKYVSERLGHSTINMTADVYLHVTKKIEDDSLKLYENYI